MDFGLGLILSFTDNATGGIQNAINSLHGLTDTAQNAASSLETLALSAMSQMAVQVGDSMTQMGGNILTTLTSVIGKVNETGQTLMFAENQLNKLYEGSSKTGKDVLADIQQYAKTSIFEFENLIPSVIMLKANGIEAFDMIASSTGNARQTLMDYAADLAAFNPTMKNAYGRGIQAAMGALNEYIAEGNAMSLKRGASLDITALLGEEKGKTIEERSRQVADLMEKLNMVGMTAQLAQSPMTKLSNMQDTMFEFMGMISDSGVYEKYTELVSTIADFVNNIPEEELEAIAAAIGSALSDLLVPVQLAAEKLVQLATAFVNLIKQNPGLARVAILATAISGALLVLGGVSLKVLGSIGMLVVGMRQLQSIGSIATVFRTGVMQILGVLIPLTLALGTMYLVWRNDLFGIRTAVTTFATGVVNSFRTAFSAVNGSLSDMQGVLATFDTQHSFFDGLTLSIMRLIVLGRALVEGWNGFTLSEDTWQRAKDLGILPLIEAIFDLKWRIDHFLAGFAEGFRNVADRVKEFFMGLADAVNGTIFEDALMGVTQFFQMLTDNDPNAWTEVGRVFGDIAAKAMLLVPIVAVGVKLFSTITKIAGVLKPLLGLIAAHPVVAIIVGVIAALGVLYANSEQFRDLVASIFERIKEIGADLAITFLPLIQNLISTAQEVLPELLAAFMRIGQAVAPIIENIIGLVLSLAPAIINIVGSAINFIIGLMPSIMKVITTISNILAVVFEVVGQIVALAAPFLADLADKLGTLIADLLPVIADLIDNVVEQVTRCLDFVLPMLQNALEALMPIVKVILNIATTIINRLIPIIKSLVTIVSNVIKAVIDVLTPVITVVVQIVQAIINLVSPIVEVILQAAGFIIDLILGVVQVLVSAVNMAVGFLSGAVNFIMGIINTIVQFIMMVVSVIVGVVQVIIDTICGIIGGIVGFVQGVWDGIVTVFSGAFDFFAGVFSSIFEYISGVFTSIGEFFASVWNGIVTTFATLGDTISGAIKGAINTVIGGAVNIINGFIKAINFAIGIINAIPGVSITKLTLLDVPQLAKGGVVESPTLSMIGEQGKEAVVPLENNTEWIDELAGKLGNSMFGNADTTNGMVSPVINLVSKANDTNVTLNNDTSWARMLAAENNGNDTSNPPVPITPVSNTNNTTAFNNSKSFITTNNTSNAPVEMTDDHSVTFAPGSIVLNVQNASEAEAMRFAKMIMDMIKREQRVEKVMSYNQ